MFPKNARSGASLAAVAVLCCAAFAARAGEMNELRTEVSVEQDYDSNIFYRDKDPIGSAITIIRPALNFENRGTLGHTQLYGFLSEHVYWSESKLTGIDRGFGGDLSRRIFPRTTIFATGSYQRLAAHARDPRPEHRHDAGRQPGAGRDGHHAGPADRGLDPQRRPRPGHLRRPPGAHAAARARGVAAARTRSTTSRTTRASTACAIARAGTAGRPSPTCSRRSTGPRSPCRATTPTSPTRSAGHSR